MNYLDRRTFCKLGTLACFGLLACRFSNNSIDQKNKFQNMDTKNTTAFVYDPLFLDHDFPDHPENSGRLISIIKELEKHALLDAMTRLPVREASVDELQLCHSTSHISVVKGETGTLNGFIGPDAYVNPSSWKCAINASGSLIELSAKVATGEFNNGFAFIRPPGHHALKNMAMGFCLFNNVAIAAEALIENQLAKKVAIVDFDVHHGNGTQAMTQDNPNIMFVSSHQFPFYPGTGAVNEIGEGEGKGSVVNIPLPYHAGNNAAQQVYSEIAFPAIQKFNPDFILVSAGYDAHWKDPLAQLLFNSSTYSWLSKQLVSLANDVCNGKIVFTLEGGYDYGAMSESVANSCIALLATDDFIDTIGDAPYPETDLGNLIDDLKKIHGV